MTNQFLEVVILRNSTDERTCAVLSCLKTDTVQCAADLREAIRNAVTEWADTEKGQAEVENNNDDFNVGDVAMNQRELEPFFLKYHILGFKIETYCDTDDRCSWEYDDCLLKEEIVPVKGDDDDE